MCLIATVRWNPAAPRTHGLVDRRHAALARDLDELVLAVDQAAR